MSGERAFKVYGIENRELVITGHAAHDGPIRITVDDAYGRIGFNLSQATAAMLADCLAEMARAS